MDKGCQDPIRSQRVRHPDSCLSQCVTHEVSRWISVRADILGAIFSTGLATYFIYGRTIDASDAGFSLNMAGWELVNWLTVAHLPALRSHLQW